MQAKRFIKLLFVLQGSVGPPGPAGAAGATGQPVRYLHSLCDTRFVY